MCTLSILPLFYHITIKKINYKQVFIYWGKKNKLEQWKKTQLKKSTGRHKYISDIHAAKAASAEG
jgi:hypothetical protein